MQFLWEAYSFLCRKFILVFHLFVLQKYFNIWVKREFWLWSGWLVSVQATCYSNLLRSLEQNFLIWYVEYNNLTLCYCILNKMWEYIASLIKISIKMLFKILVINILPRNIYPLFSCFGSNCKLEAIRLQVQHIHAKVTLEWN